MKKSIYLKILRVFLISILILSTIPIYQSTFAEGDTFAVVSTGAWYSAAIKRDGSLWTWGSNTFGQLGDGTNNDKNTPVKIMDNVSTVSAGSFHTMAIKTDGSLWAWGKNNDGELGNGTNDNRNVPVKIMDDVFSVSAGGAHTAAIEIDGSLLMWGSNSDGQLGDGTNNDKNIPVKIMDNILSVSAGGSHTAAIKSDDSLWTWGWNINGQLGDGTIASKNTPIKIADYVSSVSTGFAYTMAIKKDNTLWAWASYTGQIISTANPYPKIPTQIMEDVLSVSTGTGYSLIIKEDRSLWSWGRNDKGQLGDGTNDDKDELIKIMDDIACVSASYHSITVKTDGTLWTWGSNEKGELGDSTTDDKNIPVKIMDDVMFPISIPPAPPLLNSIKVFVNGQSIYFDQQPIIENGRTLVPLRAIFEALDAEVLWNDETKTVTSVKDNITVIFQIGSAILIRNDESITLDAPALIIGGRTFVPIRALAEAFNADVEWDGYNNKVIVRQSEDIDINEPEIQALFSSILSGDSFAAYYDEYVDTDLFDTTNFSWMGGRLRELITVLSMKDVQTEKYTDKKAHEVISEFLSNGEIVDKMSQFDLGNLKSALDNGANFGDTADGDKMEERLITVCKKSDIDKISEKLFGMPLQKSVSIAYSVAYGSFFFYNRTNLLERLPTTLPYNLYYNAASEKYLFTKNLSMFAEDDADYYNEHYEPLKSSTKLLRATKNNDEISLYIYRESEFSEYSGGTGSYKGIYRNTYKKGDNGFYWISSYGNEEY